MKATTKVKPAAYTTAAGTKYQGVLPNQELMSAFTIACLVMCGFFKMRGARLSLTKEAGNAELFGKLVSKRVRGYILDMVADSKGVATVSGLNKIQTRLDGTHKGWSTNKEAVSAILTLVKKGGSAKIGEHTVNLNTPVQ